MIGVPAAVGQRIQPGLKTLLRWLLVERAALLGIVLLALVVIDGTLVADFLSFENLAGSTAFAVEVGILALAQLLVIVTGRGAIDLSVGSQVSLASVFFGEMISRFGLPLAPAVGLTILFGLLLGSVNGFFIALARLPALIVTLATLFAYSSLALVVTGTVPISNLPPPLYEVANYWHGIPVQTLTVYVPIVILIWLLLRYTVFGRYLYALGTNAVATRFAGGPVVAARFAVFAIAGILAAIVALVTSARFASARPDAGAGLELQSITIAMLGGVAITGGVGSVPPVVIATILITLLNNGLNLAGIDRIWQQAALGGILIGSALLNTFVARRRGLL